MDISVARGLFLKPTNTNHPLVKQFGGNIIVTARGMNSCWDRFVYTKELMHLYSTGNQCADSGDKFETLLSELSSHPASLSEPFADELECFWRALAIICPEVRRQEFKRKLDANEISEYDVALQLKIPQIYVSRLFWSRFDEFLERNNLV